MKLKCLFATVCISLITPALRAQYFSTYDINNDTLGGFPQNLISFGGVLFMSALYGSNGTELGVFDGHNFQWADLNSGPGSSNPQDFTVFNGDLYFQADPNGYGAQLWKLSGTTDSFYIFDIYPGNGGSNPGNFTICDTLMFFVADDSTHGYELWVTDGNPSGTHLVKDILPGTSGSNPSWLTVLNNKLYFQANDSLHGPELWVSDGTSAGTQMLQDINATDTTGSFPAYLTVYNNKLYFQANNGINGIALWSTDGTQLGTQLISSDASLPGNFTPYNGKLYFQASDTAHGTELWVTDGTGGNTQLVSDIFPGDSSSVPQNFTVYNNKLYFQADDGVHGPELWVTDGTGANTHLVSDIYPGATGSYPEYAIVFNSNLFFVANDSVRGWQMFKYNGIDTPVLIAPSDSSYSGALAATGGFTLFDGVLAFSAEYDSTGQQLWFYGPQVLAIENIRATPEIEVYPNPFASGFNITGLSAGENYTVSLRDISGKLMLRQNLPAGNNPVYISTPALSAGVYLLQVRGKDAALCRKLIKTGGGIAGGKSFTNSDGGFCLFPLIAIFKAHPNNMNIALLLIGLLLGAVLSFLFFRGRSEKIIGAATEKATQLELALTELKAERTQQNKELDSRLQEERARLAGTGNELASAKTENENLKQKLAEQRSELEQLNQKFTKEFENLANKILEEKSQRFSEQNKTNLDIILNPFKERLKEFEQKVDQTYKSESEQRITLKTEIKNLVELNKQISQEANNLATALKGDNKQQGNWGELVLEKILERSGLQEGREYSTQHTGENNDGQVIRPDVVVNLPDNKQVIIDSKVSLTAYEASISAPDEQERAKYLKEHIGSLRNHVKILSDKKYQTAAGFLTPDFVLLFVPIESSFSVAVQGDGELFNFAWDRKIVIVSPSTLLATLRTIASIWKQEKQTRNAIQIAEEGGKLYDKFVAFCEDLVKVGRRMDEAKLEYGEAMKKLTDGSGNLVKRAEKMRELGAKNTKQLPQNIINRAID